MIQNTAHNLLPLENIIHRTASRPFSLHRTVLSGDENCALYLHCHPEAELFYLEQGNLDFQVENHTYMLKAGEGIFIPPSLIHNAFNLTVAGDSCIYRAAVFSVDMLEKSLSPYCRTYFSPLHLRSMDCIYPITYENQKNTRLLSLLPNLFTFQETALERYELAFTGTLFLCWQELYNLCFSGLDSSSGNHCRAELQASLDFMQQHYPDPLSLKDLASSVGFSEGYFCHSFRDFTGYTPFEYLNRVRIVKSCELLTQTNKKITEIATLCGFNNISYFNRTFSKLMNTTPSGYRKTFTSTPSQ